nr:immunoglobulin light chain junction region [Macaca mulatta]
CQHYYSIPRSF